MQESLLTGQVRVLELLAQGNPLEEVLNACLEYCEANSDDMLCSILILDSDGRHLRHGAAPSLPREYIGLIDGSAIACRRNEEARRMILERISDAFVALDTDWRCTCVNAKAAQILGRTAESLIGKHIRTEFPGGKEHKISRALERAMREQVPITIEDFFAPYGKWFENRIYPSHDGLTIYFCDVSDRRRSDEKLRQNEKMTAIGQLAGGIAHDFNNQLSIMLGYAGLLENRLADPELQR